MKFDGCAMDECLNRIVQARPLLSTINRIIGGRMKRIVEAQMGIGTYEWVHMIGKNKVVVCLDCTATHPIYVSIDFDRHGTDGASIFLEGSIPGKAMSWSVGCRNIIPGQPGSVDALAISEKLGLVKRKGDELIYNDIISANESAAILTLEEIIEELRNTSRISRRITVERVQ